MTMVFMNKLTFDENLAIREVLDDIIGMVDRREKLIGSVSQQAEEANDGRMKEHVAKLEELMSDFLTLFEPILTKVRTYGDALKDSISDSEAFLKSLVGIIDAGKTIEGTSATLQELEKDADEVQEELRESTETLEKIDDLFKRTKQYQRISPSTHKDESSSQESISHSKWARSRADSTGGSRGHILVGSRLSSYEPTKSQH
jgi:uncharacterized coiled-coil DUF342 family protein